MTLPCVGKSSLVINLNTVVLPDPVGPTKKTNSPLSTKNEMSDRAAPVPNFFETFSKIIIIPALQLFQRPSASQHTVLFEFVPRLLFFYLKEIKIKTTFLNKYFTLNTGGQAKR